MKICYFSCSSIYGGVEKVVIDTLNGLCKNNQCLLIVPFGCEYKDKLSSEVRTVEYKSFDKRYNPFLYLEISKLIEGYDIIHTHGAKATQITHRLNKLIKFNHIATKHNTRKGKIFNKLTNVISVSLEVSKTITHSSKVIYFGTKIKDLETQKSKHFTITAVGRLDPIKGYDKLIKEVSKLDFDFKLNIIGEGKQRLELEKLIEEKSLNNKVSLLGFQDNIEQQLLNSDLQVISSHTEGFPITLIEGILYSPIIISTPVGGIIEVLDNKYLSLIDNFSDKISEIYYNYNTNYNDFQIKHKKFKEKFNFDDYIISLTEYYKRCINERKS